MSIVRGARFEIWGGWGVYPEVLVQLLLRELGTGLGREGTVEQEGVGKGRQHGRVRARPNRTLAHPPTR